MRRPYWQHNPLATSSGTPELTPMHEALHMAAVILLGYRPYYLQIDAQGAGRVDYEQPSTVRWHDAAIELAPALIDDLSITDTNNIAQIPHRSRGYAWRWLNANRRRLLLRARGLVRLMGQTPGRLDWQEPRPVWRPDPTTPQRRDAHD